jgi:hypothetical protein
VCEFFLFFVTLLGFGYGGAVRDFFIELGTRDTQELWCMANLEGEAEQTKSPQTVRVLSPTDHLVGVQRERFARDTVYLATSRGGAVYLSQRLNAICSYINSTMVDPIDAVSVSSMYAAAHCHSLHKLQWRVTRFATDESSGALAAFYEERQRFGAKANAVLIGPSAAFVVVSGATM